MSSYCAPERPNSAAPALSTLTLLIGSLLSGGAHANPSGGAVVAGSAGIASDGAGTMNINQSTGKAIINWQNFGIKAGETVNFHQPNSSSVTLNRVVGNDPSAIFGRMSANGTVMLVNPNGIVFGRGSSIDVGGLVATTANIRDDDFMAGRYRFDQPSPKLDAMVVNDGSISIKDNGLAALVAPAVRNSGVIQARLGQVALAGARSFTLDFQGDGLLSFDAGSVVDQLPKDASGKPIGALVTNTGEIHADGGSVLLTANAVKNVIDNVINTSGIVTANSVGSRNGKIVLSGGGAGTVAISGALDARGAAAGQNGGKIVATGQRVAVAKTAALDVSGAAGGGEIALGSLGIAPEDGSAAFSGKSETVKVAAGATLKADARDNGKGGSITMWSSDTTVFDGALSARGGANGGDGGFAEVSSLKNIGLTGSADLRATKGETGLLLLDPTDLRIVDSGPGSQDGNAGDGGIGASDGDSGLNTVSRGLLEGLAGTTNIKLQATGLITIDAMTNQLIDLKTTTGHSFTLESTQSGGIRFEDAATEIRTAGGDITLRTLGAGSSLDNIGKLTSNGGNISLVANGDIRLAGAVNAGAGSVAVQSGVGSIYNTGGTSQNVAGAAVALNAAAGSVGAPGAAIRTETARLSLTSGGDIVVANNAQLSSLAVASRHARSGNGNVYDVGSTGLIFSLSDGGSYQLDQVSQDGLDFSFTGDRSIALGALNIGAGTLGLASTAGDLSGSAETLLTAGAVTLTAAGSSGANGAIGTASQALKTQASALTATAGSGGIYLENTGALALNSVTATGASSIKASGDLTVGNVSAGNATLKLESGGNIHGNADNAITTSYLTAVAAGAIGSAADRLRLNATSLWASAGNGIYVDGTGSSLTLDKIESQHGAISIRGAGTMTAVDVDSHGGDTELTANSISAGQINAGTGNVDLTARSGSITAYGSSLLTGDTVTLTAPASNANDTIGTSSTALNTAAKTLNATAGAIYINQAGAVTLDSLKAYNGISLQASGGDITTGMLDAGTGTLKLDAMAGSIVSGAGSRLSAGNVNLSASGSLGSHASRITTATTGLTVSSGADIYVSNVDKTLTSLSISNTHAAGQPINAIDIDSPFLGFDVADNGDAHELKQIYSAALDSLSFTGDRDLVLGSIKAGGSVSLTSTGGDIADDGNDDTRVAGGNVALLADQGSIGTFARDVEVDTSNLTLATRGHLYASSVRDLSVLDITNRHANDADNTLQVRAPSLVFDIKDAAGYKINQVGDSNGIDFRYTGDRDITVGTIDAGYGGSIRLTSENGSILDDGDKSTTLLANAVNLTAIGAIGATGGGHLDILTGSLSAQAGNGGIYVQLPSPTGSSNYTSTITLGTISATNGAVVIDALQGDLALGGQVSSSSDDVTLTAAQGSILNPNGNGSITAGGGEITLTAAGSIGSADTTTGGKRGIAVGGSGLVNVTARAGDDIYLSSSSSNMKLADVDAGKLVSYTQSSGSTTVGSVRGGTSVSLANTSGAILDDGDQATGITASRIALSAAGSLGSAGAHLTLDAPDVSLSSGGGIAVDNASGFTRLDITRTGSAIGQYAITAPNLTAFTLSEDGSSYHLSDIASSTDLDFGFTGANKNIMVGQIDAGAAGTVRLSATGSSSIVNGVIPDPEGGEEGVAGSRITASTVSLSAGGSIGAGGEGQAISLLGTKDLTLTAGRDMYVGSDTALNRLAITSTNTSTSPSMASKFGITAPGQTYTITDDGATQSLTAISGIGLTDFSFAGRKNIQVGAITASNSVSLATSGGGVNSSITSDGGSGRITANSVKLSASGSDSSSSRNSQTGTIGTTGRFLRLDTSNLTIANNGNIYVNNSGSLSSVDLHLTHRDTSSTDPYGNIYSFALGSGMLSIGDGNTQTINADSGGMALTLSTDRGISIGNINAASVDLTSRSAPFNTAPSINGGNITAGSVSLTAIGTDGNVGGQARVNTATSHLSIASGGNVNVANTGTLQSLSLQALHKTTGTQTHTYQISSSGLTFNVDDSTGTSGLTLTNINTTANLALSLASDRTLTVENIKTGAGGSVTLGTTGTIYGTSTSAGDADITTGGLTLNANTVQGRYSQIPAIPLYVSVDTLSSDVGSSLWVSNNKDLTLLNNRVGNSAHVDVTSGSLIQSGTGSFVSPVLTLTAEQSIGGSGAAVLTDTRQLTTQTGKDLYVNNASDLFKLDITANHTGADSNTLRVTAQGLDFNVTDSGYGGAYDIVNVTDETGLNFSLAGDTDLRVGTIDAGAGRSVSLAATGINKNITNLTGADLPEGAQAPHITGNRVNLSATGSIGAASGDGSGIIQTTARDLLLTTGGDVYVANDIDLTTLSLTSWQPSGAAAYQITAGPEFNFDVTNDGAVTRVNDVRDTTGLNFTLETQRAQQIGQIDVQPTGTVALTTHHADGIQQLDSDQHITAASVELRSDGNGAIGSGPAALNITAPRLTVHNSGDVWVSSDTHIDALTIDRFGSQARSYGITSVVGGVPTSILDASDNGAGIAINELADATGLAFSLSSDSDITVGAIDLGGLDNVTLYASSGGIKGDGDDTTKVHAAKLSMSTSNGAIGAAGSGNGIDATVSTLSASAGGSGSGVHLALDSATTLQGISAYGDSSITNKTGDIALGSISLNNHDLAVDNQGGSILSGNISGADKLSLIAEGSIGNAGAIQSTAYGGGTTTLQTVSAKAANGADGSIAISETYGLTAVNVTGESDISLKAGTGALTVGIVNAGDGAVTLSSNQGSILASSGNKVSGSSVSLTAKYGSSRSIGTSGTRLNVDTASLAIATPGSFFITNSADLTDLTVLRQSSLTGGSGGTMSLTGPTGFTFAATDNGSTTTLTNVTDTSGLNFDYQATGAISVGTVNVTSGGSVKLSTSPWSSGSSGSITAGSGSLITAGHLSATANSSSLSGSSNITLNTKVGSVDATTNNGGNISLTQDGTLSLDKLSASGALSVTATSGDLLVSGALTAGAGKSITLNSQSGSILSGGGTITGSGDSEGYGAVNLTAAHGIGSDSAALQISAPNNAVSATVTGDGSLYLDSLSSLTGGLTTSVKNGATVINANGNINLTSLASGTDAVGNDISVRATMGNITVKNVQAGSNFGQISLNADNGYILADASGSNISAYGIGLHGSSGIGSGTTTAARVGATGQRVEATSNGAVYLKTTGNAAYSYVSGSAIDIAAAGGLLLANAVSDNGAINVTGSGANSRLVAGNIDAGTSGSVNFDFSQAGGTIVDDGNALTRIVAGNVALKAGAGIGGSEAGAAETVQTTTANLTASVTGSGGLYLDDNRADGITLASVSTQNGAIGITTEGNTQATSVVSQTSAAGNDISIVSANGNLTVGTIDAKTLGDVTLQAANGAIAATSDSSLITAHALTATAVNGIGTVGSLATGEGGLALRMKVAEIGGLASTAADSVISINNIGTSALTLGGSLIQMGAGGSAYLRTAGDLDASAGIGDGQGNLLLSSGGSLKIAAAGIETSGAVTLKGATDIVAGGSSPRSLGVKAASLTLTSGSAGGDTTLVTETASIDARLTGAGASNLAVDNTGDLVATLHANSGGITVDNDGKLTAQDLNAATGITATATGTLDATNVVAIGNTINLTSEAGDINIGTVDAGSADGSIILAAARGKLADTGAGSGLLADSLDLTSQHGIGSTEAHFTTSARQVSAQVTGLGDIYLDGTRELTLGEIVTHDGDIALTAAGNLASLTGLSAGNGGDVSLVSSGGNITVSHAMTLEGGSKVSLTAASGNVSVSEAISLGADENGNGASLTVEGGQIAMAQASTAGAQHYSGDVTLKGDLTASAIDIDGNLTLAGAGVTRTLDTSAAGGNIGIGGTLNGGNNAAAIRAGTGTVTLSGNASELDSLTIGAGAIQLASVTTAGAQRYTGATTLAGSYIAGDADFIIDGAATLGASVDVATGAGKVQFKGSVDGAHDLAIAADGGDVAFESTVGNAAARLGALSIDTAGATTLGGAVHAASLRTDAGGTVAIDGGLVDTTGDQVYGERVVLGKDATLAGSSVALQDGADGAYALTIDGPASLAGAIGDYAALASLTVNDSATLAAGSIATTGDQSYNGAVTLTGNQRLSTQGGDIAFAGTVDGTHNLTIQAADGDVVFESTVGNSATRLGALSVNTTGATIFDGAVYAASLRTNAGGTVAINDGLVDTTGAQSYGDRVVLGQDTTLTGSSVALLAGADGIAQGAQSLTIDGPASLAGAIGANAALASLTVNDSATLAAGSIATTGKQAYNSTVVLRGNQRLTTQGGPIEFADTVNGSHGLAIQANGGNVVFASTIGDTARLGALSVDTAGATVFNGAVYAASVQTDAGGTVAINDGLVDTTGAQSYGERVVLGQDTALTGSSVALLGGADGIAHGAQSLAINGAASLAGAIGDYAALSSLTVNGSATLASGSITTTGEQKYAGPVMLTGGQQLSSGTSVRFNGALDGAHALAVRAGSGGVAFSGPIGGSQRLGALTVDTAGATRFDGTVRAASVQTDAPGSLAINGGLVDTTGDQRYGERAVLGANTTLAAATVHLMNGADAIGAGGQALHIAGNADIRGNLGAMGTLAALAIDGAATLDAGTVATTGNQTYSGAVTLNGSRALDSKEGSIVFGSTLDGTDRSNLAISAANAIQAAGDVGGLAALTLRAGTSIVFNGALNAYRIQQLEAATAAYRGPVTAQGENGIELAGGSFSFGDTVTASTGAITIANSDPSGTVDFARNAWVRAATGFTQTGGSAVRLPARLEVTKGPITIAAPALLPSGDAAIITDGAITMTGLYGPGTALTMASGSGAQRIGLNDSDASHKINVARLIVPNALSASMYGSVNGYTGAQAASRITSQLVGDPYYMNDTVWGPVEIIGRLAATTVPQWVVPSTPGADSLFRGTVTPEGVSPNALAPYADPQVLKVVQLGGPALLESSDNDDDRPQDSAQSNFF
ncbi:filamentous hemagglutinin N-terminal domain-containing protein [Pollutimonas bauzanensis]|nr:filamentous hemagglutinin N-terminal domain-containing protein [Pollutimonas bauzanensis]